MNFNDIHILSDDYLKRANILYISSMIAKVFLYMKEMEKTPYISFMNVSPTLAGMWLGYQYMMTNTYLAVYSEE